MMSTREKHPKIHRIALVDNDPRALDSLSAVIASKVPTAYVVWTATSGCEAITLPGCERPCQFVDSRYVDGGIARPRHVSSVAFDGPAHADSRCNQFFHQ